jgi:uncharacterized protein DUF4266
MSRANLHRRRSPAPAGSPRLAPVRLLWLWLAGVGLASGCVSVRPEQHAILADRIMQFGADARAQAALEHALDNREGSTGGGSVRGGGCGCN